MVVLLARNVIELKEQIVISMPVRMLDFQLMVEEETRTMFQIKCADCDCLPAECIESKSATECPNCTWDECCCWKTINKK